MNSEYLSSPFRLLNYPLLAFASRGSTPPPRPHPCPPCCALSPSHTHGHTTRPRRAVTSPALHSLRTNKNLCLPACHSAHVTEQPTARPGSSRRIAASLLEPPPPTGVPVSEALSSSFLVTCWAGILEF